MKFDLHKLILLLLLSPLGLKAQYYLVGQDPASIKWRQINAEKFQIIYPFDFEDNAQRLAIILEQVYQHGGKSLNHQSRKISVILHTQTVRSNGFAAWAPARVEMYTVPHQGSYAQDWLEQLAIHEFRHVVQIDKIGEELPKIFRIILGEQAATIAIGAYLPFWFLEGDAVATETALSNSGRGRLPSFEMELRAQVQEKKVYNYDKAYLGSFKDYIPDYYQLGYQLIAYGRAKYGPNIWADVLHHVARNPLSFNAFSKGLDKTIGKWPEELYLESMLRLKDSIKRGEEYGHYFEKQVVNKTKQVYTSYTFPHYINDSVYFSLKNSINDIPRFVRIDKNGNEKRLFTPGTISDESLTFSQNKVIWIEMKPDLRWTHRETSLLRILNIKNGNLWEKAYQEKLYVPQLSPDGKTILAIENNTQNQCFLVFISVKDGKITRKLAVPNCYLILTPSWTEDGRSIFAVAMGPKGKSLIQMDITSSEILYLTPFSTIEIRKPVQSSDYVFFTSNLEGLDNGYALNLKNKQLFRITDSRYGIRDLQVKGLDHKLLFSDYTSDGFNLAYQQNDPNLWIKKDWLERSVYPLAEELTKQDGLFSLNNRNDSLVYHSRAYSKLNLWNFHSWSPVYVNPDETDIQPGFSLMSQNKLSTAVTELGYKYSISEETGTWVANFRYLGLYPILDFNAEYGKRKSHYLQVTNYENQSGMVVRSDTSLVKFTYDQLRIDGGIKFPIDLTHGKMYRLLQPEIKVEYVDIRQQTGTPDEIFRGTIIPFSYRFYAHNLLRQSHRDQQPSLGQIFDFQYRHTPIGDRNLGSIWSLASVLYFPGLAKSHGMRFYSAFQQKSGDKNQFSDLILYPRGNQSILNNQMMTIRSDYQLPIGYPDFRIGRLIYLKRLSARMFYDFAQIRVPLLDQQESVIRYQRSVGGELNIDCNYFRFIAPAKIGFRESYLFDQNRFNFELLFSVSFSDL